MKERRMSMCFYIGIEDLAANALIDGQKISDLY